MQGFQTGPFTHTPFQNTTRDANAKSIYAGEEEEKMTTATVNPVMVFRQNECIQRKATDIGVVRLGVQRQDCLLKCISEVG